MMGLVPGPRNLITDVAGLMVGNAEDRNALTGTTVILPQKPMVAGVEIRGGAPGTRETPALEPDCIVEAIHAVVLSGGSVFGLDAASAVTVELARRGIGFRFGEQAWPAPVVPAAILFDLASGGDKKWVEPPYARLGREALSAAGQDFALGNAGAGMGASAGALKGGLGSASAMWNGYTVGALVAVNSVGACIRPDCLRLWAADDAVGLEMGDQEALRQVPVPAELAASKLDLMAVAAAAGANTTIAAVATDAVLGKAEAKRLAVMAATGLSRAIRPFNTPFDGDSVFALSMGRAKLGEPRAMMLARLGEVAAATLSRAVGRAIFHAKAVGLHRAYADLLTS